MNIDKLQCYSYFKSQVIEGDEGFIRDFNKASFLILFWFLNCISGHIDFKVKSYQITEHGQDAEEEEQDIADVDQNFDDNRCDIDHDEDQGAIVKELFYSVQLPNVEFRMTNPMGQLSFLVEHFPKEMRKDDKNLKKRTWWSIQKSRRV